MVHGIRIDEGRELVDSELHAFAGEQFYLLTIPRAPLLELHKTVERSGRTSHLSSEGIGFPLYLLLDEIVDGYLEVVERLEDQADEVEEDVFSEGEEVEGLQERIFRTKRKVVEFRRAVTPLREVIDLLDEHGDLVTPPLVPYYRDVLDHVIRSQEMIDNIRELLTGALDVRMAQASNRLNIVMKQLSAWAAIILIPTLIAGIYGMNFRHMPELDWKLGYPFALGVMGASAFILHRVFRHRDWL